jgi:putative MATE family efflux protein
VTRANFPKMKHHLHLNSYIALTLLFLERCCGFITPVSQLPLSSFKKNVLNQQPQLDQRSNLKRCASSSDDDEDEEQCIKEVKSKLTNEFFNIGFPAFVQLAAEPLASLVDTAYLGRLGPEVLGGAGVAISAQYAVSKLYNDPLLRTSISLVASQDGKARSNSSSGSSEQTNHEDEVKKELSIAVSSGLLLALSVGVIQLVVYTLLASGIIKGMGVTTDSPMWHSAFTYLRMRALGTPAATLWLVTNGIFRGLGDTRTPLIYSLAFTAMNAALDPLFIFTFKFGASGAALGTLLAQYIALVPLMMALNRKVKIDLFGQLKDLKKTLIAYIEAGSYVLFRSLGKVLAYSVCAREAVSENRMSIIS